MQIERASWKICRYLDRKGIVPQPATCKIGHVEQDCSTFCLGTTNKKLPINNMQVFGQEGHCASASHLLPPLSLSCLLCANHCLFRFSLYFLYLFSLLISPLMSFPFTYFPSLSLLPPLCQPLFVSLFLIFSPFLYTIDICLVFTVNFILVV